MLRLFIYLLAAVCLVAQSSGFRASEVFKISSENSPSTFRKNSPSLFYSENKSMVLWNDYRLGHSSKFCQILDNNQTLQGSNEYIGTEWAPCFISDTKYISGRVDVVYYPPTMPDLGEGRVFINTYENGAVARELEVYSGILPCCGATWYDIEAKTVNVSDSVISYIKFGGDTYKASFDHDGNLLSMTDSSQFYCIDMFPVSNGSNHAVFYMEPDKSRLFVGRFEVPGEPAKEFTFRMIHPEVPIPYIFPTQYCRIYARAIDAENYHVFVFDPFNRLINSMVVDIRGNQQTEIRTTELPIIDDGIPANEVYVQDRNFGGFKADNGKTGLITSYTYYYQNEYSDYQNYLVYANDDGTFDQTKVTNNSLTFSVESNIFFSDNKISVTATIGFDLYVVKLDENLVSVDSLKINDDAEGSNDTDPVVYSVDENSSFVLNSTEAQSNGSIVDYADNSVANLVSGNYQDFAFGDAIIYGTRVESSEEQYLFYLDIFDADFNLSKTIELNAGNTQTDSRLLIQPDGSVIVYYAIPGDAAGLLNYDMNGNLIQFTSTEELGWFTSMNIQRLDDEKFIVLNAFNSRVYNNQLEPVTVIVDNLFYNSIYVGGDSFCAYGTIDSDLVLQLQKTDGTITAEIYDLPDTEFADINAFYQDNTFNLVFVRDGKLITNQYSYDGNALYKDLQLYDFQNKDVKHPALNLNNDKILFTWSENSGTETGRDIMGIVFDINEITSVKNKNQIHSYNLMQNYPNPFNPETTISFSLAEPADITLEVYDALGKLVITKKMNSFSAGNHSVKIDASAWASGIYFYKLNSSKGFTAAKKMILLK